MKIQRLSSDDVHTVYPLLAKIKKPHSQECAERALLDCSWHQSVAAVFAGYDDAGKLRGFLAVERQHDREDVLAWILYAYSADEATTKALWEWTALWAKHMGMRRIALGYCGRSLKALTRKWGFVPKWTYCEREV